MMMKNEERFTGKAAIYKKFRSSYPQELIDYLYSEIGFKTESVIADIGSGTGIFSRLLIERGSHVYCVEPNDDMRQIAEADLRETYGFESFTSINAPAENTTLQDQTLDFVTVAQAFHWFDIPAFKQECRRILKNAGKVVLVWNTRDYEAELIKRDYAIRIKYCVDKKGLGMTDMPPGSLDFYLNGTCEERIFRNDLVLDRDTYIGMNLSRSYSPSENKHPDRYYGLVKELSSLFDEYSVNGSIYFSQFTKSYIGMV